jgi:hypothetical protein
MYENVNAAIDLSLLGLIDGQTMPPRPTAHTHYLNKRSITRVRRQVLVVDTVLLLLLFPPIYPRFASQ